MTLNVPAALFRKWMQAVKDDPEIKPARILYPTGASDQERRSLREQRVGRKVLQIRRQA